MRYTWLLLLVLNTFGPVFKPDYSFAPPEASYAFGTREDPQARLAYEARLLEDPSTRSLPFDIRTRELIFSRKLEASPANQAQASKRKAAEVWEQAGPFNVGGRTRAVGIDKTNEQVILAGGVSGSMWKTTNGGTSWTKVTKPETINSISCLTQDVRAGKETNWYYGTGELQGNSARGVDAPYRGDGIFQSTDAGETWTQLSSTKGGAPDTFGNQFQYIWSVLVNNQRTDITELWVAAYGGILKSSDGGDTWESVLTAPLFDLPDTADLNTITSPFYTNIIQTNEGHFYASLSNFSQNGASVLGSGYYFSEDGSTWVRMVPPSLSGQFQRTVIAFSPSNNQVVYFLTQADAESAILFHRYTLESIKPGSIPIGSWTDLSENIPMLGGDLGDFDTQTCYNMMISVHPTNPDIIFLGATNLYRSTTGFRNTTGTKWIGGYDPDNSAGVYPNHHPDLHALLFYPSNANKMLSASDGGLHVSTKATADSVTWSSINNGFATSQFYGIAQQKDASSNTIIGGMQDNGSYIRDAPGENPAWVRLVGGDGGFSAVSRQKAFVYASFQESQIYRLSLNSNNQLTSFARVDPIGGGEKEGQKYLFVNPFTLDPKNTNRMFLLGGNELWRNDNLAQIPAGSQKKTNVNWSTIDDAKIALGQGLYTAIDKSAVEDVLYAGIYKNTNNAQRYPELMRVENASIPGLEEVTILNHTAVFPNGGYIVSIRSNPENASEVMLAFSNYHVPSVFHSLDGGITFTDVSGNLEEFPAGLGDGPSVRWVEIVPTKTGTRYFAGTSIGLFSTETLAGSATLWIKESPDAIGQSVVVMMDYRSVDGRLVVATHGNGTFLGYLDNWKVIENETQAEKLIVKQNFPNPFSEKTYLSYTLPEDGVVTIDLYESSGKHIKNLLYSTQFAGESTVSWDGTNVAGVPVRGGIYYCTLRYGNQTKTKQMIYLP